MTDFKYVVFKDRVKVTLWVLIDSFEYTYSGLLIRIPTRFRYAY